MPSDHTHATSTPPQDDDAPRPGDSVFVTGYNENGSVEQVTGECVCTLHTEYANLTCLFGRLIQPLSAYKSEGSTVFLHIKSDSQPFALLCCAGEFVYVQLQGSLGMMGGLLGGGNSKKQKMKGTKVGAVLAYKLVLSTCICCAK